LVVRIVVRTGRIGEGWGGRAHSHGSNIIVVDLEPESPIRLLTTDLAEDFLATHSAEVRETHRRILADVLGDAGGLADRVAQLMTENAGGGGRLAVPARPAGEVERTVGAIFLWVEKVGAVGLLARFLSVLESDDFWNPRAISGLGKAILKEHKSGEAFVER
jgi:hypothetical protein